MKHTIAETARKLNVSPQAIYKRIRLNKPKGLKDCIFVSDGKKCISDKGFKLLEYSVTRPIEPRDEPEGESCNLDTLNDIEALERLIEALESKNALLEEQIERKDEQIKQASEQVNKLTVIISQQQHLEGYALTSGKNEKKGLLQKIKSFFTKKG